MYVYVDKAILIQNPDYRDNDGYDKMFWTV